MVDVARLRGLLAERYELGEVIGVGGMGEVRAGLDQRLGRQVAIKALRADLAHNPDTRRRFEREARAAARLSHPNVVAVYDSGEDDGLLFLVMERLSGETLATEMARGPLDHERLCAVLGDVLGALDAAHRAGMVHRDIKPANVLEADDGRVKVADFGIAKVLDADEQSATTDLIATPVYLAPERLVGEPASVQSDLYSVGVLAYEALAGHRPFRGSTPGEVLRAIERGRPEPLRAARPDAPAALVDVIERAMDRDPRRRFASAADMADALHLSLDDSREPRPARDAVTDVDATLALGSSRPGATTPTQPVATTATATQVLPADASPRRAPAPRRSGCPAWWSPRTLLVVVGLLVAVGLLVVVAASSGNDSFPPSADSTPTTVTATTAAPARGDGAVLPAPLERSLRELERQVRR